MIVFRDELSEGTAAKLDEKVCLHDSRKYLQRSIKLCDQNSEQF